MRYRVFASNAGVGSFDLGIYPADDPNQATKDAKTEFLAHLISEGKVTESKYHWLYNAVPVADGLK